VGTHHNGSWKDQYAVHFEMNAGLLGGKREGTVRCSDQNAGRKITSLLGIQEGEEKKVNTRRIRTKSERSSRNRRGVKKEDQQLVALR